MEKTLKMVLTYIVTHRKWKAFFNDPYILIDILHFWWRLNEVGATCHLLVSFNSLSKIIAELKVIVIDFSDAMD